MSERLTPEKVAEIAQRAEKATPGPWERDPCDNPRSQVIAHRNEVIVYHTGHNRQIDSHIVTNFDFIAHARQDIPALLSDRAELEREITDIHLKACKLQDEYTKVSVENDALREQIDGLKVRHEEEHALLVKRNEVMAEALTHRAEIKNSTTITLSPRAAGKNYRVIQNLEAEIVKLRERLASAEKVAAQGKSVADEVDAIMAGEFGKDWSEYFGPLFNDLEDYKTALAALDNKDADHDGGK